MTPNFLIFAEANRSTAPSHNARSGLTGFLIKTILSVPSNASAISWTINGLTVERAPIQSKSISCSSANSTCALLATSVAVFSPVSAFTF